MAIAASARSYRFLSKGTRGPVLQIAFPGWTHKHCAAGLVSAGQGVKEGRDEA